MEKLLLLLVVILTYPYGSAPNYANHKVKAPSIVFKGMDYEKVKIKEVNTKPIKIPRYK